MNLAYINISGKKIALVAHVIGVLFTGKCDHLGLSVGVKKRYKNQTTVMFQILMRTFSFKK